MISLTGQLGWLSLILLNPFYQTFCLDFKYIIFFIACVLSCFSPVWLFAMLWIVACQVPLSMAFSRQEYWSGLPCSPPGDRPKLGMEPKSLMSPALVRVHAKALQSCLTLSDPMDYSLPGSSVHRILQARILEWGPMPSPYIGRQVLYHWCHLGSPTFLICCWCCCSVSQSSLFVTPWTAAYQTSLSFTISQRLVKLKSIESVIPSNNLVLYHPLLLLPSIFPSIRVFYNESALRIRCPEYWSFSFNISPSNEYSGFISFKMDWLDPLTVQGRSQESKTRLKSLNSLVLSFLYSPTRTSIHDYWKKPELWLDGSFVGKVMSLLFNMLFRLIVTFLPRSKCL